LLVGSTQPALPQTMPEQSRQAPSLQKPEQHWPLFWQLCWFSTQAGSSGGQAQVPGSRGWPPGQACMQLPPHNSAPLGHEAEVGPLGFELDPDIECQAPRSPGWGPLKIPAAAPEQVAIGTSDVPEKASAWFPSSVTAKSTARPVTRPAAGWAPPVERLNDAWTKVPSTARVNWSVPS
jgi:hypothetical protein